MNRRRFLKLSVGSCALLAVPPSARAAPPAKTAVEIVERYLSACRGNRLADAYALLSSANRQMLPFAEFAGAKTPSGLLTTDSPRVTAVGALFTDPRGALGYQFTPVGSAPGEPNVVLVHARAPGMKTADALTLKVVAVPDPKAGGALKLDVMRTMQQTDPDGMNQSRDKARQLSSLSNLRQIGLALVMYTQSHDGRLPNADTWTDDILAAQWKNAKDFQPEMLFRDPSVPGGQWNYAFNRALSGAKLMDLKDAANVVMAFESAAGVKNAADEGASVPHPGRHEGGTTYVFADGRARWISDKAKAPSFHPDGT